jgi:hypothetical protein
MPKSFKRVSITKNNKNMKNLNEKAVDFLKEKDFKTLTSEDLVKIRGGYACSISDPDWP